MPRDQHPRDKILAALARRGPLTFTELLEETGLPRGVLAYHLARMKGLVEKTGEGLYKLTPEGAREARRLTLSRRRINPALQESIGQALEVISRALSMVPLIPGPKGRRRPVWGHAQVGAPVRLALQARDACIRIRETGEGDTVVWDGYTTGQARIEAHYDPSSHTLKLTVREACIDLHIPRLTAVAAGLDTSSLELNAKTSLRFATVQADTSRFTIHATLRPRGGVLASMDTSSGTIRLHVEEPGDYWLEASLDTSNLTVQLDTKIPVRVEKGRLDIDTSNLKIDPTLTEKGEARLEVSGTLDTSNLRILRAKGLNADEDKNG